MKEPEWETILKGAIYKKLVFTPGNDGMSLPCKVRTELEQSILDEFKKGCKEHKVTIINLTANSEGE